MLNPYYIWTFLISRDKWMHKINQELITDGAKYIQAESSIYSSCVSI